MPGCKAGRGVAVSGKPRVRVLGLVLATVLLVALPGLQDAAADAVADPQPPMPGTSLGEVDGAALVSALRALQEDMLGAGAWQAVEEATWAAWEGELPAILADLEVALEEGGSPETALEDALARVLSLDGLAAPDVDPEEAASALMETDVLAKLSLSLAPDLFPPLAGPGSMGTDGGLSEGGCEGNVQGNGGGSSSAGSFGPQSVIRECDLLGGTIGEGLIGMALAVAGLLMIPVVIVLGATIVVAFVALGVLGQVAPQPDRDGDNVGDAYDEAFELSERAYPAVADPDGDGASTLVEYQWRTIPVGEANTSLQDALGPMFRPAGEVEEAFTNAPDFDGDGWLDGPEITYWSAYLDRWLQGSMPAMPDAPGVLERTQEAAPLPEQWQDPGDPPPHLLPQAPSWQELVGTLNGAFAWRHPGFYLDTDGDGLINVWDADSEDDGLLDGHSLTVSFQDVRRGCFQQRTAAEAHCDPYSSHTLVHHDDGGDRTFPGEMTLGTYPEFTDSDCLSTLPGSGLPAQCHPSREIDRRGEPGHGDGIDDAAEYQYWASLLSDDDYQAHFPNVTEPWNHPYDWDRVDNALLDADSDDDGLMDGEEIQGCRTDSNGECLDGFPTTDPWRRDSDGDGLSDAEEDAWGTDPRDWDSDGDDLPDGWEAWYGFDPSDRAQPDTHRDPDGDGLTNWDEYCRGTDLSCTDDEDPLWTANWCGPNPRLHDTDEEGTNDEEEDPSKVYDCTPPSAIGEAGRLVEPWAEPNYDLGYIDPTSDAWLKTGRYAKKHAADPVTFTNRTLTNPEQVLTEIRENLTQDTETLERFVLPPTVRHEAWPVKQEVQRRVEPLLTCADQAVSDAFELTRSDPQEVASTTALGNSTPTQDDAPAIHGPPLPPADDASAPQAWLGDRPTVKPPVAMPKSVDCALGHVHRTVDEAREIVASALPTAPLVFADKLSQRVKQQAHDPPDPVQLVPETLPEPKNLTLNVPNLPLVDATFEDLNSQVPEPAITDPWSLVSEPDAFPNLASDLTANDLAPPTLYDELVAADELTSDNIGLVTTTDAATWDLLLVFPNGTRQQVQNIPVGTPRPVHLYKDCVDNAANTTQLLGALSCTADLAEPDLIVELTPEASAGGHAGYAFTATTTTTQSLPVLAAALIQIPNQDRGLAMGLDGRPDAADALEAGTAVGPLPSQSTLTATVNATNATGADDLALALAQEGATGALVVAGGLYGLDPHDPEKPRLDTPRTEATVLLDDPPAHTSLRVRRTHDEAQRERVLDVTATGSAPTPVRGSIHHRSQRAESLVNVTLDALPPTASVTLHRSPSSTHITHTHSLRRLTTLSEVAVEGWYRAMEDDAWAEPDLIDLRILDPPESANLQIDRSPESITRVNYHSEDVFTQLDATFAKTTASCRQLPTENQITVVDGCTHVSLQRLWQADARIQDGNVDATWLRSPGYNEGDLGLFIETPGLDLQAHASPWMDRGTLSAAWLTPTKLDWDLTAPMDALDLRFQANQGPRGRLSLSDLPRSGTFELDADRRSVTLDRIDPAVPIGRLNAWITTGTQLPRAPVAGDHVLVNVANPDQPGKTGELHARVLLNDLGGLTLELDDDASVMDLQTSQGRELTVHYDAGDQRVKAHMDEMPPAAGLSIQRATGSNLTLEVHHTGARLPTVTASGLLDNLGFDVHAPGVPNQVTGYLDTRDGQLGLDASGPLTLRANLTGGPNASAPVLPLPGFAKGVSMNLQQDLANLTLGVHVNLQDFLHARISRATDPTSGLDQVVANARASQPTPLAIATLESGGTAHLAEIQGVPAETDFTVAFNDNGGELHYAASHPVDAFQIATLPAPDEDGARERFAAYGTDVPRSLDAIWQVPDDPSSGTLEARLEHSGTEPINQIGFQYVQEHAGGQRVTVKAVDAKDLSTPVAFTLEDRHEASLDLGATGSASELAVLFAEQMPRDRVTMPDSESHGVHLQREAPQRYSLAARFHGPHSFERMQIPTEAQPRVLIDARLDEPAPLEVYVEDDVRSLAANVTLNQFGGGPVHVDGSLAFGDRLGEPHARLNLALPTPLEGATVRFENETTWAQGTITTQATELNATFHLPEIELEADAPMALRLHSAPAGQSAPAPASTEPARYALIDRTGALPLVGIDVTGVTGFHLRPGGSGALTWDTATAQDLLVRYIGKTTKLHRLAIDDLPATGAARWNATEAGFDGHLEIPPGTTIPRIELNLTERATKPFTHAARSAEEELPNGRTVILATLTGLTGPGAFEFIPAQRAYLNVPGGIDAFHGQVLTGATGDQRLAQLDDQLGVLFEQPVHGSATYESAFVAHLANAENLDARLEEPPVPEGTEEEHAPGGLKIDGTLTLHEATDEPLWLRVNTPGSYMDATTSNLPATTTFHLDTREAQPLRVELDWPTGQVDNVTGEFRAYQERNREPREQDLNGAFTLLGAKSLHLTQSGHLDDGALDLRFGGDLQEARGVVNEGTSRVRFNTTEIAATYDAHLTDEGSRGDVTLVEGAPAPSLTLEYKAQDDLRMAPQAPQYILATANETTAKTSYVHANLHGLRQAAWGNNNGAGFNATLIVDASSSPAYLEYKNRSQTVTAIIQQLPEETRFDLSNRADTTVIDTQVSAPITIQELTYRNTTSQEHGVLLPPNKAREEREWANVSLALVNATRLDDTRLELTSLGEGGDWLNLTTDGINEATLFGVLRGELDDPGRGKQIIGEMQDIPQTSLSFHHKGEQNPDQAPFMVFDSTQNLGRVTVAYRAPVNEQSPTWEFPARRVDQYINVEDVYNRTLDMDQRLVQLNLADVIHAEVDPATPTLGCPTCTPFAVRLARGVGGHPLLVNLNATMNQTRGDGFLEALTTPRVMDLETGLDTAPENGKTGGLRSLVVGYNGTEAMTGLETDLVLKPADNDGDRRPATRLTGSIEHLPRALGLGYHRDPRPGAHLTTACGYGWSEKLPSRLTIRTGTSGDPLTGMDLSLGAADGEPLTPDQWTGDFLGLVTGQDPPTARLRLTEAQHIDVEANASRGLVVEAGLFGSQDLKVSFQNARGTVNTSDDDVVNVTLRGSAWPAVLSCDGTRLSAQLPSGERLDELNVTTNKGTFFGRQVNALRFAAEDVIDGFVANLQNPEEGASRLVVNPARDRAGLKLGEVDVRADLQPPRPDQVDMCRAAGMEDGKDFLFSFGIPTGKARFFITTNQSQDPFPELPNRVRRVSTCYETTLAGDLMAFNNVTFESRDPWMEIHADMMQRNEAMIELIGWDEGEATYQRFEVNRLPFGLDLRTTIKNGSTAGKCAWSQVTASDSCFGIKSTDRIGRFERFGAGACDYIKITGIDQSSGYQELAARNWGQATFHGVVRKYTACPAKNTVSRGIDWAGNAVDSVVATASDGAKKAVRFKILGPTEPFLTSWDVDGWGEQRNQPRFTRLDASFDNLELTAVDEDRGLGAALDFSRLARWGSLGADFQPQWIEGQRLSNPETLADGTLDLPPELIDPRCVDWNHTTGDCDKYETWEQVVDRILPWFEGVVVFQDGREYEVPRETWREALT